MAREVFDRGGCRHGVGMLSKVYVDGLLPVFHWTSGREANSVEGEGGGPRVDVGEALQGQGQGEHALLYSCTSRNDSTCLVAGDCRGRSSKDVKVEGGAPVVERGWAGVVKPADSGREQLLVPESGSDQQSGRGRKGRGERRRKAKGAARLSRTLAPLLSSLLQSRRQQRRRRVKSASKSGRKLGGRPRRRRKRGKRNDNDPFWLDDSQTTLPAFQASSTIEMTAEPLVVFQQEVSAALPPYTSILSPAGRYSQYGNTETKDGGDAQLLALKEESQMPQLPEARPAQHRQLEHTPPHRPRVDLLAQQPKLGLPLPLELLLPPDVRQAVVEVPHFRREVLDVFPLAFFVDFGFADGDVEVHPDLGRREPPTGVVGTEADCVVAGFVRGEGELSFGKTARVDDLLARLDLLYVPDKSASTSAGFEKAGKAEEEDKKGKGRTATTICTPN